MEKTAIIAIVLGVLVLTLAVQAVQLNTLKDKVGEAQLTVSSAKSSSQTSGSSSSGGSSGEKRTAALPKSIQDLPQMVGGC